MNRIMSTTEPSINGNAVTGKDTTPAQQDNSPLTPSTNNSQPSSLLDPSLFPQSLSDDPTTPTIHISLTFTPLSPTDASLFLRSPTSGANVLFLGTTRNTFNSRRVTRLSYSAYPKLALYTLLQIGKTVQQLHGVERIYIAHRLGDVPVAEESIIVGVSSAHRGEGWSAAEEILERVKERAEIWKMEWFADSDGDGHGEGRMMVGKDGEEGVWRENRGKDRFGNVIPGVEVLSRPDEKR